MEENKGHCKHGEFILTEGCPQCMAERRKAGITPMQDEMEDGLNSEGLTLTGEEPATENFEEVRHECKNCGAKWSVRMLLVGEGHLVLQTYSGLDTYLCPECNSENTIMFSNREKVEPAAETAITLRPGADAEAMSWHDEALKALAYANDRKVTNAEEHALASDDLNLISKLKKLMEARRKELLDPLKAQSDAIRETYTFLMGPVIEAEQITKQKMLAFDAEQKRIRAEQEEINRKRQEAAEAEMRLKGELTEPVNLIEVSPDVRTTVSTDLGMTGQTDHWKYEVIDFALLPDEFKVADTAMLNAIAKKHHDRKQIPGVLFFNEPFITSRPR